MSPRFAKRDIPVTASRNYADPRSFVSLAGHEYLYGEDMTARRLLIYHRFAGRCALTLSSRCRGFANLADGELDHIVSRGKGGSEDVSNLRWTCKSCHRLRHVHPRWTRQEETVNA